MKKILNLLLCISIFFAGCAGREPNPIALSMPGDNTLSCNALESEMTNIQNDMQGLKPKTDKLLTNTLWGTAGFVLIFPFFLMDVKDAEKIEYNAFQQRYNRLLIIAKEKDCNFTSLLSPLKSAEAPKIITAEEKERKKQAHKEYFRRKSILRR